MAPHRGEVIDQAQGLLPYDVAIQRLILEGLGMKVVPCLMHLNRDYVYDGKQYDLEKLFVIQDLTAETAAIEQEVTRPPSRRVEGARQAQSRRISSPGDHCTHPFRLRILRPLQ